MVNVNDKMIQIVSKQLKIFSDGDFLPAGLPYIALLYAFWGKDTDDATNPNRYRYDRYTEIAEHLFEMAPLDEANLVLLPFDAAELEKHPEAMGIAQQLAQTAAQAGIPLAIFYLDDAITPIKLENTLVFRTSANRSTRQQNEVVIPAWSEDFVEHYCQGEVVVRSKSSEPIVGYCGYSTLFKPKNVLTHTLRLQLGAIPGIANYASKLGIELVKHPLPWLYGSRIRSQAIFILERSSQVECNFVIRDRLHHTEKLTLDQRQQFVDNMLGSDYILCTRGGGNFSYRLYETLSCGRIPVFINTDCELPFEQWIDWKKYCVWVEEDELPYLGDRIREFHDRLSPQQFRDLQMECRNLWLEWLSPQGFFTNFHRYF
jgi:hypothetical protein